MTLSVIICTSAVRPELGECLKSLKAQKDVEYIVVNNSRKHLKIADRFRVATVEKQGLSHARNIGLQKAKGEYIAYIDDDSIADKNWVKNILDFIQKYPQARIFGGGYERHADEKIPGWVWDEYSTMSLGDKVRQIDVGQEWLAGTNMIFKKNILQKIGGFDTSLGMIGNKLSYGEEIDVQIKIAKLGLPIYYSPKIRVSHLLHSRKLTVYWVCKDAYIRGKITQRLFSEYHDFFKRASNKFRFNNSHKNISQNIVYGLTLVTYILGKLQQKFFS